MTFRIIMRYWFLFLAGMNFGWVVTRLSRPEIYDDLIFPLTFFIGFMGLVALTFTPESEWQT